MKPEKRTEYEEFRAAPDIGLDPATIYHGNIAERAFDRVTMRIFFEIDRHDNRLEVARQQAQAGEETMRLSRFDRMAEFVLDHTLNRF